MSSIISNEEVRSTLAQVLGSKRFAASQQLKTLLEYIVTEAVEGRADELKAYTIAIDVLGQPDDFDPQSDPRVRILAGRLRNTLELYYADEGADDPIEIVVPKGRYRPVFSRREDVSQSVAESNIAVKADRKLGVLAGCLVAAVLALFAGGYFLIWSGESTSVPVGLVQENISETHPIIEIAPFSTVGTPLPMSLVRWMRQQLIVELAHFKSVRIRELSNSGIQSVEPVSKASYQLDGAFQSLGSGVNITLKLTRVADNIVVWSRQVGLPENDHDYHKILLNTVTDISVELVSETGVIANDSLGRLQDRFALLGNFETSDYECLILFYAYDTSKTAENEALARACLDDLIEADTKDSNIWASYALLQFLDWSRYTGPDSRSLIEKALSTAQKAVRLDPMNAGAHEHLGSILSAIGDSDAALKAYQRGLELNPSKPTLHFFIGWQAAASGDWESGIPMIRYGVTMMPDPPGYMLIPLAIDAFRNGDYEGSIAQAETITAGGDQRGIALAYVAALAMDDPERIEKYSKQLRSSVGYDPSDPIKEVRRAFGNPAILRKYDEVIAQYNQLIKKKSVY